MSKTEKLKLIHPVEIHDVVVEEIVIREPTGRQYLAIGEPRMLARNADGTAYQVEDQTAIRAYIEGCVVEGKDTPGVTQLLSLTDVRRVKDAVLGFFIDADLAIFAASSPASPSTSG